MMALYCIDHTQQQMHTAKYLISIQKVGLNANSRTLFQFALYPYISVRKATCWLQVKYTCKLTMANTPVSAQQSGRQEYE